MRRTSARRELAFVVALAVTGLALVLVVVFAPWYSPSRAPAAELPHQPRIAQVADDTALAP